MSAPAAKAMATTPKTIAAVRMIFFILDQSPLSSGVHSLQ